MAHHSDNSRDSAAPGPTAGARVIDGAGNEACIVSIEPDAQAWIRLQDGTQVLVPTGMLAAQEDGVYRLPFTCVASGDSRQAVQMHFPVMEEELHTARRVVDTGRGVRIHKTVSVREQVAAPPLLRDRLEIAYVPIGRVVDEADPPQPRHEGDTLVVPVLEEVLVVRKQLLLKEEVRITRRREEVRTPETVVLRAEQVRVERFDEGRKE